MEQKVYFKNLIGNRLVGILSNPTGDKTKPIVVFVHGHSSSKETRNFSLINELLIQKGISTFRFDLSGHGESEGEFANTTVSIAVNDILYAIKYLDKLGYTKIGLVGSSFGGIACIGAASKSAKLFVTVLKAPVSNYKDLYVWRKEDINKWKKQGYRDYLSKKGILRLNYDFYEDAINNDGYIAGAKIKVPTLIVHGDCDEQVPLEQSIKLAKIIPDAKLIIIKGADHTFTDPMLMKQKSKIIVEFIIQNL